MSSYSAGELVASSGRQIKMFTNTSAVLQPGEYLIASVAFNHWGTFAGEAETE